MATESLPASACLSLSNWVIEYNTAFAAGSSNEQNFYKAANLLLEQRTERWWSNSAATSSATLISDLGSARLPTFLALADSNLGSGKSVELKGSSDLFGLNDVLTWTYTTYAQDPVQRMLRFYLGAPDSGSAATRRYWRLTLPANGTTEPYHKLGVWWLGEREAIGWQPGLQIRKRSETKRQRLPGGSVRRDTLPSYHEIDGMEMTDRMAWIAFYERLERFSLAGNRHVILDLHGNTTDAAVKKRSAYYGMLSSIEAEVQSAENSNLSLGFEEAQGRRAAS